MWENQAATVNGSNPASRMQAQAPAPRAARTGRLPWQIAGDVRRAMDPQAAAQNIHLTVIGPVLDQPGSRLRHLRHIRPVRWANPALG